MAVSLEVFDISWVEVAAPEPGITTFVLPLGGAWRPNDWRIVVACGDLWKATSYNSSVTGDPTFQTVWSPAPPPAGWTAIGNETFDEGNFNDKGVRTAVLAHKLAEGDADGEFSIINPAGAYEGVGLPRYSAWFQPLERPGIFAFTVRGVDPSFTPTCTFPTITYTEGPPSTFSFASRTLSNLPGFEILIAGIISGSARKPSTWTDLWNNGYSLTNVIVPSFLAKTMGLIGKRYTASPSGTTVLTCQEGTYTYPSGSQPSPFGGAGPISLPLGVLYFKQAQDVVVAVGTATAVTTTTNIVTPSVSTAVTVLVGTAHVGTVQVGQVFSPLSGYGIHDPYILPGTPVLSSIVRWTEITPAGARVTVHTSLDGGATWTQAVNGEPVPGLRFGDTTVDAVLARVSFERDSTDVATPKVYLDVQVSCDSGTDELLPLGTFLVKASDIDVSTDTGAPPGGGSTAGVSGTGGGHVGGGTSITLKGSDLSSAIDEHVWEEPHFIAAGTLYSDALRQMVVDRLPGQTRFSIATTLEQCPLLVYGTQQGAKPWQDIRELAISVGWDAYFDPYGTFVARPILDPSLSPPVWRFTELDGPPITSLKRSLTRAEVFNHIIVDGEATSPQTGQEVVPVHAEWRNLDPNHPTFIGGKFGIKPYKVTLPVTSQAQAQVAADALGILLREGAETVEITVPPNPALEPGDVVELDVDDAKVAGNYVIHGMDTPSSAARGQRLTCHRQSRVI